MLSKGASEPDSQYILLLRMVSVCAIADIGTVLEKLSALTEDPYSIYSVDRLNDLNNLDGLTCAVGGRGIPPCHKPAALVFLVHHR